MKRKVLLILMLTGIFLFFQGITLLAQEIPAMPETWTDVIMNFNTWFSTFYGVVVFTAFVASVFTGLLKAEKDFHKQLIAWVVAIAALIICRLLSWGYVAEYPYFQVVIHGFAAGLASNGFFKIPKVKGLLDDIDEKFRGPEEEDDEEEE